MSDSIGLIRVSSVSQSDNTSLDNQRLSIKKFCQDNGISLSSICQRTDPSDRREPTWSSRASAHG